MDSVAASKLVAVCRRVIMVQAVGTVMGRSILRPPTEEGEHGHERGGHRREGGEDLKSQDEELSTPVLVKHGTSISHHLGSGRSAGEPCVRTGHTPDNTRENPVDRSSRIGQQPDTPGGPDKIRTC